MQRDEIVAMNAEPEEPEVQQRPAVIEVRNLDKDSEIPLERVDSIKERVLHPATARQTRKLHALRDVSFDVHQGEFFGIVGRNGTGKSTLLKILASIYGADSGRVRVAGRIAPFIELGVGFNTDLTARENIVLNGVLIGLTRKQAESRIDSVIEFAELEDFTDMKLKNFSSGMLVRLAFSVMIQSDAEILLIDEVLAVGDAAFQQKCRDVFHEIRGSGRTVVLVTHDMPTVEQFCHRAMLLHRGATHAIGDPSEVAYEYLRLNYASAGAPAEASGGDERAKIRLVETWLDNEQGERTTNVAQREEFTFNAVLEAVEDVSGPSFGFMLTNEDGVDICGFGETLPADGDGPDLLAAGERLHVRARIDNRLATGRYFMSCRAYAEHSYANLLLAVPHVLDFVVYGVDQTVGVVSIFPETHADRIRG